MHSHTRVLVIGGGVVGASVLYHLTKLGWSDVTLIERKELTAGSTWHAAAGFHAINGDVNIAALQKYTIGLYRQLEQETSMSIGLHMPGGVQIASTPERWEFLRAAWALNQVLGLKSRLVTPEEVKALVPIMDADGVLGGLYDPDEGHLDPYSTTHAYVAAAKARGASVILRNRVLSLAQRADGTWDVTTEQGRIHAEHVVNAAGLWAPQVGRMVGVDLPVAPMEHHYLITETIPELVGKPELGLIVDLEGFTYMRQEHQGVLLGIYELKPKHWHVDGAPWDWGIELIPEDIDRIAPELEIGFRRFPPLERAGIKKWVNGAFTFTPDGNPLVGPLPGVRNYWCACGVMAGFSQGGGVGLALAEWMTSGEIQRDIFGMDVARYFPEAGSRPYLKAKTAEFYSRRFQLNYPNEVWPAARPLKTTPIHDRHQAKNAVFGVSYGLEYVQYYMPPDQAPVEIPSFRRSNAHGAIAAEHQAVRTAVGMAETGTYSKFEVTGPGAEAWLSRVLAGRMPQVGRIRLQPMLNRKGRLMGDLTLFRLSEDRFWLFGSGYLQRWHSRWFSALLPESGVTLVNQTEAWLGFALSGPKAQAVVAAIADREETLRLPFMGCGVADLGPASVILGRIGVTGEQGYELYCPAFYQRALHDALLKAGEPHGLREIGFRAVNTLRLEKGYGIWSREFTPDFTPRMSGLDRFVDYAKPDFVGRDAALAERDGPAPGRSLVLLEIAARDADAWGYEPVWSGGRMIGHTTSGGFGHHVGKSLALAYCEPAALAEGAALSVHVVGEELPARLLHEAPYDPSGSRLRG